MKTNNFNDRDVDKASLKKTKKHMWNYIQSKVNMERREESTESTFGIFFRRMALSAGAMAFVLLLAFGAFILKDSISFFAPKTVYADFQMEANDRDSTGIESDSTFTLRASDAVDDEYIEDNLTVSPDSDFSVEEKGENEFEIIPEGELDPNTVYRFTIKNGEREFSWAYQVKDEFKVSSTLPGNEEVRVPVNSGIEINFSHENYDFENFKNYFSISPQVNGKFEYHYRTVSFVPDQALSNATIYTVTVKEGLPVKDSDQKLLKDYSFQFETGDDRDYSAFFKGVQFNDFSYESAKNRTLAVSVNADYEFQENNLGEAVPVTFYKFRSEKDYIDAIKSRYSIPGWSHQMLQSFKYDKSNLAEIGVFDGIFAESENYRRYLYFPENSLENGYYLMEITNEKNISQSLMQVSDISSYATVTKTKSVIWVNDVSTKKAVSGAEIEILELGLKGKTDDKGVLQIDTPEEFKTTSSTPYTLKITSGNKVLYSIIKSAYSDWRTEEYWKVIFTDRPIYMSHDEVKFSGFLKARENTPAPKDLTLVWSYGNSTLESYKIKPDKYNHFNGKIDLNGISPGWYVLTLKDGDITIDTSTFEVSDYTKPAYDIVITPQKNALFKGEEAVFDVKAEFFDGTPVPNTELYYSYSGENDGKITTDLSGKAQIKIKTGKSDCFEYCSVVDYKYLEIYPVFAEEADIRSSSDIRVFSKVAIKVESKEEKGKGTVEVTAHEVDLKKLESNLEADHDSYFGEELGGQAVNLEVMEITWDKVENGSYYDFINKVTVPKYDYTRREKLLSTPVITTDKDGKAVYNFDVEKEKFYEIKLSTVDKDGNRVTEMVTIFGADSDSKNYEYFQVKLDTEHEDDFRHIYENGDTVTATVVGSDNVDLTADVDFLFSTYNNGLNRYELSEKNEFKFKFNQKDLPEVWVEAVFFDGTQYKRAYGVAAEFKEELKRLNVEVNTDKAEYKPGDKVKMKVKVSDSKNKPVSTMVNVNLVDEAYFKMIYDYFYDPLMELYGASEPGKLTELSSHETPMASMDVGGKGGCFLAGTKILMADGSYKNIEDIEIGDNILTKKDFFSMQFVPAEVKKLMRHDVSEYLVINGKIKITPVHVVWLNGKWMPISEAQIGDVLLNKDHQEVKITSIERVVEPVKVYNFEVEKQHTYFAEDIYVHNDKGGGIGRSIFEDTAVFQDIRTNGNGEAEIEFTLPHNITSWRVMARAVDIDSLSGGFVIDEVKVSLPFFVDLIMNREYSVLDKPFVKFRAFGNALKPDDQVKFDISAKNSGVEVKDITAGATKGGYFEINKLTEGKQKIVLKGAFAKYKDSLEESIEVKSNNLKKTTIDYVQITEDGKQIKAVDEGLTTVTFLDRGLGTYYGGLVGLLDVPGNRVDQAIARQVAVEYLEKYFDQPYSAPEFISNVFQEEGIRLLPYADTDLRLSVLTVAMDSKKDRFNQTELRNYFMATFQNKDSNLSEIVLALTGLASINEPVLTSLDTVSTAKNMTVDDKLFLALAYANIGDLGSAEKIWNEVATKLNKNDFEQNALASVVAATVDDKDAETIRNTYIGKLKDDEYPLLYELGYLREMLKKANAEESEFKVNGKKVVLKDEKYHSIALKKGESAEVVTLKGQITAVVISSKSMAVKDFKDSEGLDIQREYSVYGSQSKELREGDIVSVRLKLDIDKGWKDKSFEVVDILPSGLAPVTRTQGFNQIDDTAKSNISYPWMISGKEVRFIIFSHWIMDGKLPDSITYYARVVNPGEFYADPARIQMIGSETASISEPNTITIKKAE